MFSTQHGAVETQPSFELIKNRKKRFSQIKFCNYFIYIINWLFVICQITTVFHALAHWLKIISHNSKNESFYKNTLT